jgi:hypothetical protein
MPTANKNGRLLQGDHFPEFALAGNSEPAPLHLGLQVPRLIRLYAVNAAIAETPAFGAMAPFWPGVE